jgi:hypothetical protein
MLLISGLVTVRGPFHLVVVMHHAVESFIGYLSHAALAAINFGEQPVFMLAIWFLSLQFGFNHQDSSSISYQYL